MRPALSAQPSKQSTRPERSWPLFQCRKLSISAGWITRCPMRHKHTMGRTEVVKRHLYDTRFLPIPTGTSSCASRGKRKVRNLPETLVQYRRHSTNMSTVYRARLNETGVDIALREIRPELPDFRLTGTKSRNCAECCSKRVTARRKELGHDSAGFAALHRIKEAFQRKHPTSDPQHLLHAVVEAHTRYNHSGTRNAPRLLSARSFDLIEVGD